MSLSREATLFDVSLLKLTTQRTLDQRKPEEVQGNWLEMRTVVQARTWVRCLDSSNGWEMESWLELHVFCK